MISELACICGPAFKSLKSKTMLQTIAIILLMLWLVGLVTSTTLGGLVHVLLVVAIILFLFRFIGGARV